MERNTRLKEYFFWDESPCETGKYLLKPNFDLIPLGVAKGSYALLAARVAGLDYADYLRFCRDKYGATIIGKNHIYPLAYFDAPVLELQLTLNRRMYKILES